jgi:5'/3'-nucleotidase SurE
MDSESPLHILLTNDDGHAAPGIQILRDTLKRNGYRVTMVAPSGEQSATSMSTTMNRSLPLVQTEADSWHLDAAPADTVLVALRHLLESEPPDLVVSGVNFGPNLGLGLHASGTVGAALIGVLHGLPAIAVSAGMLFEEAAQKPRTFPSTVAALQPAADFTCTVIDSLRATAGGDAVLLPPGLMLNINYPALPPDRILGVLYPEVSTGHMVELGYHRCQETGHVIPRFLPGVDPARPHREFGDVRAHLEGYITISPVKPSWNPPPSENESLRRRLDGMVSKFVLPGNGERDPD